MNSGWQVEVPVGDGQPIEIHMIHLDAYYSTVSGTLREVLSHEELERAGKFVTAELQHRYMAGQHFLRSVLAQSTATSPWAIRFSFGKYGKPYLRNASISFNLTHSAQFAAVGLSRDREIGIDLQTGITLATALEVAPGFLAPAEMKSWAMLEPDLKVLAFTEYWVLKEAILKACGRGLSINPNEIELVLESTQPRLQSLPGGLGNLLDWSIGTCRVFTETPLVAWALRA